MRRWIGLAAKLYPREWRERYGAEFGALLEDAKPGWRELGDVVRGALLMQVRSGSSYLKMACALAAAGAVLAGVVSWRTPDTYVSSAVLRITPGAGNFSEIQQEMLSRGSLAEFIRRPTLDLYRSERQGMPLEVSTSQTCLWCEIFDSFLAQC